MFTRKTLVGVLAAAMCIAPISACSTSPADDAEARLETLKKNASVTPDGYPSMEAISHLIPEQMVDVPTREEIVVLYKAAQNAYLKGFTVQDYETQIPEYMYFASPSMSQESAKKHRRIQDLHNGFLDQYEFTGPDFAPLPPREDGKDTTTGATRVLKVPAVFTLTDNTDPAHPETKECSRTYVLKRTPVPRNPKEEEENLRPEAEDLSEKSSAEQPLVWRFADLEDDQCLEMTGNWDAPLI